MSSIALLVTTKEVLCLGFAEGAASNYVHPNEGYQSDQQNNIGHSPIYFQVFQQARFTGTATVAQLCLVVTPQQAIKICTLVYGAYPISWIHKCISTFCWRFTASRLQRANGEIEEILGKGEPLVQPAA